MNIVLIGARASGKTTIGGELARILRKPFVDLDLRVLAHLKHGSVVEVWEKLGEAAWRAAEFGALQEVFEASAQVIALGGGTPMIPQAHELLQQARQDRLAAVIWLNCPVDTLSRRLDQNPGDRPSLTSAGVREETADILAQREPVYRELADLIVDSSKCRPEETARSIAIQVQAMRPER